MKIFLPRIWTTGSTHLATVTSTSEAEFHTKSGAVARLQGPPCNLVATVLHWGSQSHLSAIFTNVNAVNYITGRHNNATLLCYSYATTLLHFGHSAEITANSQKWLRIRRNGRNDCEFRISIYFEFMHSLEISKLQCKLLENDKRE